MPTLPLTVTFPPSLDSATATFTSISNVLAGVREYDNGGVLKLTPHARIAQHLVRPSRQPQRPLDRGNADLIQSAWRHELSARVHHDYLDDDMLRRVGAQGVPTQVYYAIFNAARAATALRGAPCNTHAAVLNDYEAQMRRRGFRAWGVCLAGDPDDLSTCTLTPSITAPAGFNPMAQSHRPEDYVFAALRMARRWRVETLREEWIKKNKTKSGLPRKNLPAGKKAELGLRARPTTIFDFIYGMRVRSNYESVEEYGSDAANRTMLDFHSGMLHLTDVGLLHYEMELVRIVGLPAFEAQVDQWLSTTSNAGSWAATPVERRFNVIVATAP